jgi:hypothetical protein
MIEEALELEVDEYIQKLRHRRDENGHALVVRNGKATHGQPGSWPGRTPGSACGRPTTGSAVHEQDSAAVYATFATLE